MESVGLKAGTYRTGQSGREIWKVMGKAREEEDNMSTYVMP